MTVYKLIDILHVVEGVLKVGSLAMPECQLLVFRRKIRYVALLVRFSMSSLSSGLADGGLG